MTLRGSRKWSVVMFALAAASVLCAFGKVSGAEFAMIATTAVTTYAAANAYTHKQQNPTGETQ